MENYKNRCWERERNNEQEYRDGIMEDVFYFSTNSAFCNLSYYGVEVKFKANKKNTKSYKKKVPWLISCTGNERKGKHLWKKRQTARQNKLMG